MKIKYQLSSLELSKKLKELGVVREAYIFHMDDGKIDHFMYRQLADEYCHKDDQRLYNAYSASELLDMLPKYLHIHTNENNIGKLDSYSIFVTILPSIDQNSVGSYEYIISYRDWNGEVYKYNDTRDLNLCNALAKMLIYLLENKLMEIPNDTHIQS